MIKLLLSILLPVLFLANYWACEYLYPGSNTDWAIFIPMDKLCHNFWAVIMFGYAVVSTMKTKYDITMFFLYVGINFSLCDVLSRAFGMSDYDPKRYLFAFVSSLIISGLAYVNYRKKALNQ